MILTDVPRIETHLPERRRRAEIRMCHGSCCCCCCLHTVGGIIGSAVAPAFGKKNRLPLQYYYDEEFDIDVPDIAKPGVSAVRVFWLLTAAAALLGVLIGATLNRDGGGVGIALFLLVMVFPAVQLGTALITLIWLAASSRPDKSFQLWQLGKISVGLFAGTAAGIVVMVVIGVVMSR